VDEAAKTWLGSGRAMYGTCLARAALYASGEGRLDGARVNGSDKTNPRDSRRHLRADRNCQTHDIDPQAWLADVPARLPDQPAKQIHDLLPSNWRRQSIAAEAA